MYCMCWFDLVSDTWGCLVNSHAPITARQNISNGEQICLGLFDKLIDRWIPVDSKLTTLVILDLVSYFDNPFSHLQYGIPLGALDGFLIKINFFNFYVLQIILLTMRQYDSQQCFPFLDIPLFTYNAGEGDASVLFLFSNFVMLPGLCIGALLGPYLRYGVNHVYIFFSFLVHIFVSCVSQGLSYLGVLFLPL